MAGLVRFSETLRGFVDVAGAGPLPTHEACARAGRSARRELIFMLTVVTPDVDALIADPLHRSPVFGCVLAPWLARGPLRVERGHLDLFVDVDGDGRLLHMRYVLPLVDDETGARFVLRGVKEALRRRPWPTVTADTTTLFVDVWRADALADVAWRGVLHEGPVGVLAQLVSFRGDVGGLWRYLRSYVVTLLRVIAGPRRAPRRPAWAAQRAFTDAP
jgi:hypothetical protein